MGHDILIIGAGVLGAATAWHLTRMGHPDVHIIDQHHPPQGTTAKGAGILSPLLQHPHDVHLTQRSLHHYRTLDQRSPTFTLHETGGLLVTNPRQRPHVRRMERMWKANNVPMQRTTPRQARTLPGLENLHLHPDETLHVSPQDAWAQTTHATAAFLEQAQEKGATLQQATIHHVDAQGAHPTDQAPITANTIILATGAQTPHLLDDPLPLGAFRAQAARIQTHHAQPPGPILHDAANGLYWRPEDPHALILGDGTDLAHHDTTQPPEPDADIGEHLTQRYTHRIPNAKPPTILNAWAGYAAGTPDQRPLIGPHPRLENVILCTGGNGFGFMRAPALGEITAHHALTEMPPFAHQPYLPHRFDRVRPGFPMKEGFAFPHEEPQ